MGINIIPVQGTFDIARGRNVLRTHIAAQRWNPSMGARAGALLTAIGEMIISAHMAYAVPVEISITSEPQQQLKMRCTIALNNLSIEARSTLEQQVRRTADAMETTPQVNQVCLTAYLYPVKEALYGSQ